MKKLVLILTFLLGSLSLLAQEPVIKFYLLDGSTKQYNISDIENIKLGNESGNSTMKIYYQDSLKEEFASKSIDKILFEVNTSNILLLSIYVSNIPHQFILSEIDSISYVSIPVLHITNVFPSSGEIGDEITITGTCFGSAEGTSVVSFNGTNVSDYTSWSDKEIKFKVPTGATSGKISVTVNGTKSNEVDFTVLAPNQPQIININPSSAIIGNIVTITGRNFSNTQGSSYFTFNGKNATEYPSWSETEIKVKIPTGSSSGKTSVTVNGTKSNEVDFAIIPNIANANPQAGRIGDTITISGSGFGSTPGSSIVSFNGKNASEFINWNTTQIKVKVPQGAETGKLSVTASGQKSNEIDFVIIPSILSINPTSARIGDTVTITGIGFGSNHGSGTVTFNQKDAIDYLSWNDTEIKVIVPQGAETGKVSVTASGKKSNEIDFAVIPYITEITPNSAKTGETITISGTGFGSTKYSSSFVAFYSQNVIDYISWSSTEIKVKVPEKAESGKLYVMVNGIMSNDVDFNVIPNIISVNPPAAKIGDIVTLTGTGYGSSQGNSIVSFNGTNASEIIIWNSTQIKVKVPQGAETGKLSVTASGQQSNEVDFTIIPYILNINPTAVRIGDEITISGTGFGSSQSSGYVSFNDTISREYTSWNSTEIKVKVPQGAETGKLYVTASGQKSNGIDFTVIPDISDINPPSARIGDTITITGTGFGSTHGTGIVSFTGANASEYISWSSTSIKVKVPPGAETGKVSVTASGQKSNEVDFTIIPCISTINPTSGYIGDFVTITGTGFGASRGSNYATFNGTDATEYSSWSSTEIKVKVPTGTTTGKLSVTVGGIMSNEVDFTVKIPDSYETVTIGTQVWMLKNLDVDHYRNGDSIPEVREGAWSSLTTGAWCYYNNDPNNGTTYGKLYNWFAINDSRGLAPAGWHIPSDAEWKTLEMYLGMTQAQADNTGIRGSNEGNKLKETGTTHWSNNNGTNESGFTALPGGYRYDTGTIFYGINNWTDWWTSTLVDSSNLWDRSVNSSFNGILRASCPLKQGKSIRCVKD